MKRFNSFSWKCSGVKLRRFSVFSLVVVCMCLELLGSAEAVQVKGKPLSAIGDIVKQSTGNEFPDIEKHSLLFVERFRYPDYNDSAIHSQVFTINNDGTLDKTYDFRILENVGKMVDGHHPQNDIHPAISPKRFGTRRTVAHFLGGNENGSSTTAAHVFSFTGENDNVNVTAEEASSRFNQPYNAHVCWGSDSMKLHAFGDDKDVFIYLHSTPRSGTVGVYVDFVMADRNEEGAVGFYLFHTQKLFDMNDGCRAVGMAAVDIDGDGYKNEFAVVAVGDNHVYVCFYTVNYQNGYLNIWRLHDDYISYDNDDAFDEDADKRAFASLVAGDFDGDGVQELATVTRIFRKGDKDNNTIRVNIFKYYPDTRTWDEESVDFSGWESSECRAARADFDGDGKDELAILFCAGTDGKYHPKLGRWYCDYK